MNQIDATFFVWADTHFGYVAPSYPRDWHASIIDQMQALVGRSYPDWVGGTVDKPAAVLHVGDLVDGQLAAETELSCYRRVMEKMPWQQIEILGNHDLAPAVVEDFVSRHGHTYFTNEIAGVRILTVSLEYDGQSDRIDPAQLAWLGEQLQAAPIGQPVILLVHSPLPRVAEAQSLLACIRENQRVLVLAGHLHRPKRYALGNAHCVDVGHCRDHPIDRPFGRNFYVVRITNDRMTAVPWRWDEQDWERGIGWANPIAAAQDITLLPAQGG